MIEHGDEQTGGFRRRVVFYLWLAAWVVLVQLWLQSMGARWIPYSRDRQETEFFSAGGGFGVLCLHQIGGRYPYDLMQGYQAKNWFGGGSYLGFAFLHGQATPSCSPATFIALPYWPALLPVTWLAWRALKRSGLLLPRAKRGGFEVIIPDSTAQSSVVDAAKP